MSGIHSDITSAFGNTPLVRLNRVSEGLPGTVLAKLEFYNPASSVKDRLGIAIVDAAEASGELKPGGTIVFSNCSLDPLEGEQLVADLLAEDPRLERVPVSPSDWPGLEEAVSASGEFRTTPAMLPSVDGMPGGLDGFFASVLRRR